MSEGESWTPEPPHAQSCSTRPVTPTFQTGHFVCVTLNFKLAFQIPPTYNLKAGMK